MRGDLGERLLAGCEALAADLTAAGCPATLERTQLNPAGNDGAGAAWLSPQTVDVVTLSGGAVARVHVVLVVPQLSDVESHRRLANLLDLVTGVGLLVPAEPVDTSWALVIRDNALPAYRVSVDIDI